MPAPPTTSRSGSEPGLAVADAVLNFSLEKSAIRRESPGVNLLEPMTELAKRAKSAARELARLTTAEKNACLLAMASALEGKAAELKAANALDMEDGARAGLSAAMLDRLKLDDKRIAAMARGLREVAELPDPVGRVLDERVRPNGLRLKKITVPIGVGQGVGDPLAHGDLPNGRHYAQWRDPHPKPTYLFALVAGAFDSIYDDFVTSSGRKVKLGMILATCCAPRAFRHRIPVVKRSNGNNSVVAIPAA